MFSFTVKSLNACDVVRSEFDGLCEAGVEGVHDSIQHLAVVQSQPVAELVDGDPLEVHGARLVHSHRPGLVLVKVGPSVAGVEAVGKHSTLADIQHVLEYSGRLFMMLFYHTRTVKVSSVAVSASEELNVEVSLFIGANFSEGQPGHRLPCVPGLFDGCVNSLTRQVIRVSVDSPTDFIFHPLSWKSIRGTSTELLGSLRHN